MGSLPLVEPDQRPVEAAELGQAAACSGRAAEQLAQLARVDLARKVLVMADRGGLRIELEEALAELARLWTAVCSLPKA